MGMSILLSCGIDDELIGLMLIVTDQINEQTIELRTTITQLNLKN